MHSLGVTSAHGVGTDPQFPWLHQRCKKAWGPLGTVSTALCTRKTEGEGYTEWNAARKLQSRSGEGAIKKW